MSWTCAATLLDDEPSVTTHRYIFSYGVFLFCTVESAHPTLIWLYLSKSLQQWRCFLHRWRLVAVAKWWRLHSTVTWQRVCQTQPSGLVALRQVQEGHSKDLDPPFTLILNYCFTHDRPRPHRKITWRTDQQWMSGRAKLAQGESEVDILRKKQVPKTKQHNISY